MVDIHNTECCGLGQLRGVGTSTTLSEVAAAIREAQSLKKGYLIATLTQNEANGGAAKTLFDSNFKSMGQFKNPETGTGVTIYGINIAGGKWVPA